MSLPPLRVLSAVLGVAALCAACGSRLVKKEDIQRISKDYEKIYVIKDRVETGNFDSLGKGAKVRIYFKAAGEYISVYAYPHSQLREEASGKNILQLFETDFPDKKFKEEILRERIAALVEEYKGKGDEVEKKPAKRPGR